MANEALSALTATTTLADVDLFYVLDGANSRKITYANLKTQLGIPTFMVASGGTLSGTTTYTNAGAGSNPTLASNAATQQLSLTGQFSASLGVAIPSGQAFSINGESLLSESGGDNTLGNINALDATTLATIVGDLVGQQTIWMPAGAMTARTTNGAASGSTESTTNKVMVSSLDFDDSTDEFAQFDVQMPKSWDEGTLIFQFVWKGADITGDKTVVWGAQAVAFADDDALDTAFGTAVTVSDANGSAADDVMISAETSALTIAGSPSMEEWVKFQVYRDADNASDNFTGDAQLIGVKIHYTTNATKDD